MNSCSALTTRPSDLEEMNAPDQAESDDEAAFREYREQIVAAASASPAMKATFIVNLLASTLLLVASFLILSRRRSALWWTRQALTANAIHAIAFVVGSFYFAQANEAILQDMVNRWAEGSGQGASGASATIAFAAGTMCASALMLGIYAIMLRVARREDVRGFVLRETG